MSKSFGWFSNKDLESIGSPEANSPLRSERPEGYSIVVLDPLACLGSAFEAKYYMLLEFTA